MQKSCRDLGVSVPERIGHGLHFNMLCQAFDRAHFLGRQGRYHGSAFASIPMFEFTIEAHHATLSDLMLLERMIDINITFWPASASPLRNALTKIGSFIIRDL